MFCSPSLLVCLWQSSVPPVENSTIIRAKLCQNLQTRFHILFFHTQPETLAPETETSISISNSTIIRAKLCQNSQTQLTSTHGGDRWIWGHTQVSPAPDFFDSVTDFIPRGGRPLVCSVDLWSVCKGPWGGVQKEGDTRLEELTI